MGIIVRLLLYLFDPFGIIRKIVTSTLITPVSTLYNQWKNDNICAATARDVGLKTIVVCFAVALVLWISIFTYISFYYAYMPAVEHIRPVFMQIEYGQFFKF